MSVKDGRGPGLRRWLGRLARHLWLDTGDVDRLLGRAWAQNAAQTIAQIERDSSVELRLCVEAALPWSWLARSRLADADALIRERAIELFAQLGVWDTEHNSGVLIYVLLAEHAIEVVADRGLRDIGEAHWQELTHTLAAGLRAGQQERALTQALLHCGQLLSTLNLPPDRQGNELPDAPHVR